MQGNVYYNEVVIAQTRPHWVTYILPFLWFILVASLFVAAIVPKEYFNIVFIVSILPFLYKYTSNSFKTYAVTNHRVIYKKGILHREEVILPNININNVFTTANFFQRMVGAGNITISTGNDSNLCFHNVKNPQQFSGAISSILTTSYNKMAT